MKRFLFVPVCLLVVVALGCNYTAPVKPPLGAVFTNVQAPLTTEFSSTPASPKSGQASSSAVLGLVSWGDCSLDAAAKNGGLTTIDYCDYAYLNVVLGIYQGFTVTAHGR